MRILYVMPFVPRAGAAHGGRMLAEIVTRMANRHDIGIVHLRPEVEPSVDASLRDVAAWIEEVAHPSRDRSRGARAVRSLRLVAGTARMKPMQAVDAESPALRRALSRALAGFRPDVVQFDLIATADYARLVSGRAPVVLVAHDVGASTAEEVCEASSGFERGVRAFDALAWRRFERRALACADAVVALTSRDVEILRAIDPRPRYTVIPFGPWERRDRLSPVGRASAVLFVGGFGHPPNVDAAVRLATAIFPRVAAQVAGAELVLVGASPTDAIRRLAGPNVSVVGDAPSTEPYLDAAAVVVAPLRLGGGMRVKVLDALAAGKAIVASSRAVAGLDVAHGETLLVADTDDEIVEAVVGLLRDEERRRSLGAAAGDFAGRAHGVEAAVDAYDAVYGELVSARRAG